jgi:hypothetical protein
LIQDWENTDAVHIGDKQGKTGPAGQSLAGLFDAADLQFLWAIISAIFAHKVLHLLGLSIGLTLLFAFKNYTKYLPLDVGLLLFKNRLD